MCFTCVWLFSCYIVLECNCALDTRIVGKQEHYRAIAQSEKVEKESRRLPPGNTAYSTSR